MRWFRSFLLSSLALLFCGATAQSSAGLSAEDRVLARAATDRDNWRLHGRTYGVIQAYLAVENVVDRQVFNHGFIGHRLTAVAYHEHQPMVA